MCTIAIMNTMITMMMKCCHWTWTQVSLAWTTLCGSRMLTEKMEDGRWEKKLRKEEADEDEDGLNNQIQNTRTDTDADTSTKYNKIQRCERRYRRGEGEGRVGKGSGSGKRPQRRRQSAQNSCTLLRDVTSSVLDMPNDRTHRGREKGRKRGRERERLSLGLGLLGASLCVMGSGKRIDTQIVQQKRQETRPRPSHASHSTAPSL